MIDFFNWLIEQIIKSKELRKASAKDKSEILRLLKLAIKYTNKHIEDNRNIETGEDKFSDGLMNKWAEVASLIRVYNSELARIFDSKSDYWYNPEKFKKELNSGSRNFDFRFRLTEVEKIEQALNNECFG